MNFDSQSPIDVLIGRLLAFIIMFEKKIQMIKCKLSANEEFHTRLAFQKLDLDRKNEITSSKIYEALRSAGNPQNEMGCQNFIHKYCKSEALTYEEFLKLLSPKGNKMLSQRMMIRAFRRGAELQDYLYRLLVELIIQYIKMSVIIEQLKRLIQQNEDISSVQLIQFFHLRINNPNSLITFLNVCGDNQGQYYDIQVQDAVYLSYHVSSGNDLSDFTDIDIKQLIFPFDFNYRKHNTINDGFYKTKSTRQQFKPAETKTNNFLGKTYQKMYQQLPVSNSSNPKKDTFQPSVLKASQIPLILQVDRYVSGRYGADRSSFQNSYGGGLYIDNFARSDIQEGLEIDRFLSNRQRAQKGPVEVFVDEVGSHGSSLSKYSRESAFDRS